MSIWPGGPPASLPLDDPASAEVDPDVLDPLEELLPDELVPEPLDPVPLDPDDVEVPPEDPELELPEPAPEEVPDPEEPEVDEPDVDDVEPDVEPLEPPLDDPVFEAPPSPTFDESLPQAGSADRPTQAQNTHTRLAAPLIEGPPSRRVSTM